MAGGKASLTGSADIEAQGHDYVQFSIDVKTQCYKTSKEAKAANNALVVSIQEILKDYQDADCEYDKVFTSGGWVSKFFETVYDGEESRTICQNTFQKTTTVTFRTGNVDGFSEIYDAIEERVLSLQLAADGEEDPRDLIELSTPSADICEKTVKTLDDQAYAQAVEDARRKFEACRLGGGITCVPRIVNITDHEQPAYGMAESYSVGAVPAMRMSGKAVEVKFENRHVRRNVRVEFAFDEPKKAEQIGPTRSERKKAAKIARKKARAASKNFVNCFHKENCAVQE